MTRALAPKLRIREARGSPRTLLSPINPDSQSRRWPVRKGRLNLLSWTEVELVQNSFNMVVPNLESAAMTFYDRLFDLDRSLRRMFHGRPQQILGAVEELGRRHLTYGVRQEHYATVGAAVLWTLQTGLGDAFTLEVREAWTCAYLFLSSTMQQGGCQC